MEANFSYYKVGIKLIREMLGTNPEASIMEAHVLQKSKKKIAEANRLGKKVTKALAKFQGPDIVPEKELEELHGILRVYMEQLGEQVELPQDKDATLALAAELEEKFNALVEAAEAQKATVFQRDKDGKPRISLHQALGNAKEVLRIITNGGDKSIFKSKVQLGESMALDLKFTEEFATASNDIKRDKEGNRLLLERPLRFTDAMGHTVTAIASSEVLPAGTEFHFIARVRKGSPIDSEEVLNKIWDHGKSLGLGAWRGSGGKGAFLYKLEPLPDYKEDFGELTKQGWR